MKLVEELKYDHSKQEYTQAIGISDEKKEDIQNKLLRIIMSEGSMSKSEVIEKMLDGCDTFEEAVVIGVYIGSLDMLIVQEEAKKMMGKKK